MKRNLPALTFAPALLAAALWAGESAHDQAVAAIKKQGGTVELATGKTDSPVTVALTGAKDAAGCFPHLKHIANLRCVDL